MEKTTMLQGNEDVRSEMQKILWTPVQDAEDNNETNEGSNEDINVVVKDNKIPENKIEIPVDNENIEKPKVAKKERKAKSATNKKPSNGEWANSIPDDEKLVEGDILYCIGGDGKGKFAKVIGYGKKENIVWANMFKKNSTDFMNRPWSLTLKDVVVVYKDGKLSEGYSVNEEGIYSKEA